jgi:hypothetical protein
VSEYGEAWARHRPIVRRTEWTGGEIVTAAPRGLFPLPASRHHHVLPGVWDPDNGPIAGRVCDTCWKANRPIQLDALLAARWAYEHPAEVSA